MTISEVAKKNIDPIAVNQGVFFNFTRTGEGLNTTHRVSVVTEAYTPPGSTESFDRIKKAPLTPDILKRIGNEGYDLGEMFRVLTSDEVARLVKSAGDSSVVDAIFASPEAKANVSTPGMSDSAGFLTSDEPSEDDLLGMGGPISVESTPVTVPSALTDDVDAQIAALIAKKAASAVAKPAPVATPAPAVAKPAASVAVDKKSNVDFLAEYGSGKL